MAWWALLLGILFTIVSYFLMPRPKAPPPPAVEDLEDPSAEAGRPIPVVFGTMTVKGLNVLWFGDKSHVTFEVDA